MLITHANVSRLFDASEIWFQFARGRDARSFTRVGALGLEIWGALLWWALVIVPIDQPRSGRRSILARERVTILSQTPAAFQRIVQRTESA